MCSIMARTVLARRFREKMSTAIRSTDAQVEMRTVEGFLVCDRWDRMKAVFSIVIHRKRVSKILWQALSLRFNLALYAG